MTTTKRLEVRDALIAAVATATSLTPFKNLDFALEARYLPAVAVTSGDDQSEPDASTIGAQASNALFQVHVLVAKSADPEASADAIEKTLRDALYANRTLGGKAVTSNYLGGEWDFFLGDCVVRRLTFNALFIS